MATELHMLQLEPMIKRALTEDWGHGDWTTDLCVPQDKRSVARLVAKESFVLAGTEVAHAVFKIVDPELTCTFNFANGASLSKGDVIFTVQGRARSILKAERVALNYLGRMSGIATMAQQFCKAMEGLPTVLLDTRKTTPGLRILEKAASKIGGARNHRMCLTDGVLLKENHIRAAGGITQAIGKLRESLPPTLKIEVETTCLAEVQEALDAGADLIMLDNMSLADMRAACALVGKRVPLEASGNVRLDNIRAIAETGVDYISTSAVFHSSRWTDISLLFDT